MRKLSRHLLFFSLFVLVLAKANAQPCSGLGQTPSTSFPVCGLNTFVQNTVPLCNGTTLPCPPCSSNLLADRNPYWYKFTCYNTGTLGFTITPFNLSDDYDWQIFDVTGKNPNDVYTDPSMFVCCNWSGTTGVTGTSPTATVLNACEGNTPILTKMPTLLAGHDYLLMISHFTPSQSGYTLSFGGGSSNTAGITDPVAPALQKAMASCDGKQVFLKLSKKMKCNSLTGTGSEFSIGPSSAVASAVGVGCTSSFDMDSVVVSLLNPLPPGNYSLVVQNGSDANTILDNCSTGIPAGDSQPFTVLPQTPTLMDSISPVPCSATSLQLVFRKPIRFSSIATDLSDFAITGPAPITISVVSSVYPSSDLTTAITLNLTAPISIAGNYQIKLLKGTDGNTILNECLLETPLSTISFVGLSAANAVFSYQLFYGCKEDTLNLQYTATNGVTNWKWTFDDSTTSTIANPVRMYSKFGAKTIKLWATNTICSDSTTQTINLINDSLIANFVSTDYLCPNDVANFSDSSKGHIISWNWDFNNGNTSTLQAPPMQTYLPVSKETKVAVRLMLKDTFGCYDTAYRTIKLIPNCNIAVATAFTPNGDGKNDYLYPLYAYKADKLTFRIFNRYGQLVFSTNDWTRKWDGTLAGKPQDGGVYVWMLQYTDRDTGKQVFEKGTSLLIR